jgi:hypothetical protein
MLLPPSASGVASVIAHPPVTTGADVRREEAHPSCGARDVWREEEHPMRPEEILAIISLPALLLLLPTIIRAERVRNRRPTQHSAKNRRGSEPPGGA